MSIIAKRNGSGFTVDHADGLVEVALAMAELSRRWGRKAATLQSDFEHVLAAAKTDPKVTPEELRTLELKGQKIVLLEQLAQSFRETVDEGQVPRFQGTSSDGFDMLRSYGRVVGAKLEIRG